MIAFLVGAAYIDVFVWPDHNVGLIEAIPVIFATSYFSPKGVLAVAILAIIILTVDAILARSAFNIWAGLIILAIVYGYFLNYQHNHR